MYSDGIDVKNEAARKEYKSLITFLKVPMAAISEECSENYSKERYKKEEGKVYHNYTTKFNIMIQVAAVNHLRVIDHANILPVGK